MSGPGPHASNIEVEILQAVALYLEEKGCTVNFQTMTSSLQVIYRDLGFPLIYRIAIKKNIIYVTSSGVGPAAFDLLMKRVMNASDALANLKAGRTVDFAKGLDIADPDFFDQLDAQIFDNCHEMGGI